MDTTSYALVYVNTSKFLLSTPPPPSSIDLDSIMIRALDLWEESKVTRRMDTNSYIVVMAMCEQLV